MEAFTRPTQVQGENTWTPPLDFGWQVSSRTRWSGHIAGAIVLENIICHCKIVQEMGISVMKENKGENGGGEVV